MRLISRLMASNAGAAIILVRLTVGAVFLSEGIQKFLFPVALGPGRFAKIGFSAPEFTAYFVAVFEITCGTLILAGLLTRLAAIPTTIVMIVAITTTKLPMLRDGEFWKMAHEARVDYAMLLGSVLLIVVGAGRWSFDHLLSRTPQTKSTTGD